MNILFSITNLGVGGVTDILLQLASSLSQNHNISIYSHYPYLSKIDYKNTKFKNIKFLSFTDSKFNNFISWKINRFLKIFNPKYEYWEKQNKRYYLKQIINGNYDLLCSLHFKADYINAQLADKHNTTMIFRIDGNYGIENNIEPTAEHINIINYIFSKNKGVIYTCDFHYQKIIRFINENNLKTLNSVKILNSLSNTLLNIKEVQLPSNITSNSFVFGMIARGDIEKGWNEAIASFTNIINKTKRDVHLVFIGNGDNYNVMSNANNNERIHFMPYNPNPMDWINKFDVCLLPTYFSSESNPMIVLLYLAANKPVIATNYVEIPNMITLNNERAGILIDFDNNGKANIKQLEEAMLSYLENPDLIIKHSKIAEKINKENSWEKCVKLHEDFFKSVIESNFLNKQ